MSGRIPSGNAPTPKPDWLPELAHDLLSGAGGTNKTIDGALTPDPDGLLRIDKDELAQIVRGYEESNGSIFDGRASIEAHAREHKPALLAALEASRNGEDPWSAYIRAQVDFDMSRSSRAGAASNRAGGSGADPAMASAKRITFDLLKRPEVVQQANDLGTRVESLFNDGTELSSAGFRELKEVVQDETLMWSLSQRLSSLHRAPIQWLQRNPGASQAEFMEQVRAL